jgi:hypothetical protein
MRYSHVLRLTSPAHVAAYIQSNPYNLLLPVLLYSEPDFGDDADNPGPSRSSPAYKLLKSLTGKQYVLVSADIYVCPQFLS